MNIVTGVFDTVDQTETTVRALIDAGYNDDWIGLIVRDEEKGNMLSRNMNREYWIGTTPPSGVVTTNRAVFDRLPDGFVDVVRSSALPNEAVNWYQQHLDRGHILVVVNAGDRMPDAERIMRERGGMLYPLEGRTEGMRAAEGEIHLPIIDEEIVVERTPHQIGEVMVSSETMTQEMDVPTTIVHEEIRVERRKLDHAMRLEEYKGSTSPEKGVIRMPIIAEEVRVTKTPVIREELIITRVPVSESTTVHEEVMHTEPHLEPIEPTRPEEGEQRRPAA